jgi:hypothetical protein
MSPDQRARRGENEAIFREVNETVAGAAAGTVTAEPVDFLCECARDTCAESVPLRGDEYERVRAVAERFIVRPRHTEPEIENVVERHADYWVVEKIGEAAEVAERTDPRSED